MQYSINDYIVGKDKGATERYRHNFANVNTGIDEFIEAVCVKGFAYSAQFTGGKAAKENFVGTHLLSLDFDGTMTLEEATHDPFITQNALLIYTTPSHGQEGKGDRFRVVFKMDTLITSSSDYTTLYKGLLAQFPRADKACSDSARFFYGSPGATVKRIGKTLTRDVLPPAPLNKGPNSTPARKGCKFSIDEIKKLLSYIPPNCPYDQWRSIVWAVVDALGEDEALPILEEWAPNTDDGGHIRELARRCDGRITIKTAVWYAKQYGYKPPTASEKRTPEQIAHEDVYASGLGYITLNDSLYAYNEGGYVGISDAEAKQRIAYYFDKAGPVLGETNLGTAKKVEQALKYVKMMTYIDPKSVNQGGLCLENGVLNLSYSPEGQTLHKDLMPHTPEKVYTSQSPVVWTDDIDTTPFDDALNRILDEPEREILLRTLAASLDIDNVRKKLGRYPKALFLLGLGANGKDTIREWLTMLLGNLGITNIPIQNFKSSSPTARFGLFNLSHSRVNWSSENDLSLVDGLQMLKQVVSGDPITVEQKYKDPVSIKPRCALLFNVNEPPVFRGADPAITSRYAVIEFKRIFTNNPDDNDPNQAEADPRLKDDPDYIRQYILPGFLKRLLEALEALYNERIDYSSSDTVIDAIRGEYSHVQRFIDDCQIKVVAEGKVKATDLYRVYRNWAGHEGIYKGSEPPQWYDPDPAHDPAIKSIHLFKKRLKQHIPNFKTKKMPDGTYYNVTFTLTEAMQIDRNVAACME